MIKFVRLAALAAAAAVVATPAAAQVAASPKATRTAAEAARRRGVRRMNVYPLWVEAVVTAHHPVGSTGSLFFRISI